MNPFEALYGRKCGTPVSWDKPTYRVVLGPKFLKEMEDKMVKIKYNLKTSQDRQKVYVDKNRTTREFKVGEHVLKVKPKKSSLNVGSCTKITTRFCDPFEILDKIGPVSYMIALPVSMHVHNLLHIFFLKKYVHDPNHTID
jgi:hypothetical protein